MDVIEPGLLAAITAQQKRLQKRRRLGAGGPTTTPVSTATVAAGSAAKGLGSACPPGTRIMPHVAGSAAPYQ